MLSRRAAASRLGVSLAMMVKFERDGRLTGDRDSKGRVFYEETLVEELRAARAEAGAQAELVLDAAPQGGFIVRPASSDPVDDYKERRMRAELDLRERELALRERELLVKFRTVDLLAKNLPQLVKAVERGSWASVGGSIASAIPEETRGEIIKELVAMFKDNKEER